MDKSLMTPDVGPGKTIGAASHRDLLPARGRGWPAEHLAALRQHVAAGLSSPDIADLPMFKRRYSRGAIIGMAQRLGLRWKNSRQPAAPEPPPPPAPNKYRKVRLEDVRGPGPLSDVNNSAPIFALRLGDCRYITAGGGLEAVYCCQPTVGTGSWCAHHTTLVFGRTR